MGGDFSVNPGQFGFSREDPSRNLGLTYGSPGPWAGAVFNGMGKAMGATSPIGVASMGVQAATGKSLLDHALSAMGISGGVGGLLGGNPAASGLTPDQIMAMSARGEKIGRGGLLDVLGDVLGGGSFGSSAGGRSGGVGAFDRGGLG